MDAAITETEHLVRALKNGEAIDKILVEQGNQRLFAQLQGFLNDRQIPIQFVPREKLDRVTRRNHRGFAALKSAIEPVDLDSLFQQTQAQGNAPFWMLLDRVTDVRNFGGICRSLYCAGAHGVVIPAQGSAAINADAVKTSAGALMKLPVARVNHLKDAIFFCQASGIQVLACTEKASQNMYQTNLAEPVAILMGNEELGIHPGLRKLCDGEFHIPMGAQFDSLNVGVAAAVAAFEVLRQRKFK